MAYINLIYCSICTVLRTVPDKDQRTQERREGQRQRWREGGVERERVGVMGRGAGEKQEDEGNIQMFEIRRV